MKKALKVIGLILACLLTIIIVFIGVLTITEYRPKAAQPADKIERSAKQELKVGSDLSIVSWNIGYAGLGKESDFFMDGGDGVADADEATVKRYLGGIEDTLSEKENASDITILQEVDEDSARSHRINETEELSFGDSYFAKNYSCIFVPYPLPPIGKVDSGLMTSSNYKITEATRLSLPSPFKWPVKVANLKRCLLLTRVPIENSSKELVVVNFHLEAYESGEGRIAQMKKLKKILQNEYEKGNYVIAGGDFNQYMPGAIDKYPNTHKDLWSPGQVEQNMIPDGFKFEYDLGTPSCRLNNQPYNPNDTKNTQHYVIDGFIVSPNVKTNSIKTIDAGFENSDHNPVRMTVKLEK